VTNTRWALLLTNGRVGRDPLMAPYTE